jgi:hypothetical protein
VRLIVSGELPEQKAKGIPLTRQTDEANESGLVMCAKNARPELSPQKFLSKEDVDKAMERFPEPPVLSPFDNRTRYVLSASPGSARISQHDPKLEGKRIENWQPRKPVVSWSDKSRSRMVERLATLDYSPFDIEETTIAFLTLTYPGDWLAVASTASDSKKHLRALQKRFERSFGRPFFAVWKMEFQHRGAPHFHLLAPIPVGVHFAEWLSSAWAEIVNHPNPEEKAKHLLAGTGTDIAKGINADSPQRISYYFSKHSSANKGPKEYQNIPPAQWIEAGSVGRFWGYWGLKTAISHRGISEQNALFVARTLRRWQRAQRKVVVRKIWRTRLRTGEIYQREIPRRERIYTGAMAFRILPNCTQMIEQLGDYLSILPKPPKTDDDYV